MTGDFLTFLKIFSKVASILKILKLNIVKSGYIKQKCITMGNTYFSPSMKEQLFSPQWFLPIFSKRFRSTIIYAETFTRDDLLAVQAIRVRSFRPVLQILDISGIFACKLASQGFHYDKGFVRCYYCDSYGPFKDVQRGNCPRHTDNCTAEQEQEGLSVGEKFWGKMN